MTVSPTPGHAGRAVVRSASPFAAPSLVSLTILRGPQPIVARALRDVAVHGSSMGAAVIHGLAPAQ